MSFDIKKYLENDGKVLNLVAWFEKITEKAETYADLVVNSREPNVHGYVYIDDTEHSCIVNEVIDYFYHDLFYDLEKVDPEVLSKITKVIWAPAMNQKIVDGAAYCGPEYMWPLQEIKIVLAHCTFEVGNQIEKILDVPQNV